MDPSPSASDQPSILRRVIAAPFHRVLDQVDHGLATGAIEATLPDGTTRRLGGRAAGPVAIVALHRWRALRRLALGGSIGWYEGWAAADWSSPDPVPLFDLFMRNAGTLGGAARAFGPWRWLARRWHARRRNDKPGARRNIAQHYDLGNDFYREWLDPTLTYSSALFAAPIERAEPLETAQRRKLAAMLKRAAPDGRPSSILEIGCGWGSFAETAVRAGHRYHGITLSTEQREVSAARGAGGDVTLTDYRDVTGQHDAIVSIEMVEALGEEFWPAFVRVIADRLRPGGRAALQFITIDDALHDSYRRGVDFIQRYVFPGGALIAERRFRALAEARGLVWTDRAALGAHYAETLRRWRASFDAAVAAGRLPARFDERFTRLWRYYLMYCEGGFRGGGIDVVQVTLVKT